MLGIRPKAKEPFLKELDRLRREEGTWVELHPDEYVVLFLSHVMRLRCQDEEIQWIAKGWREPDASLLRAVAKQLDRDPYYFKEYERLALKEQLARSFYAKGGLSHRQDRGWSVGGTMNISRALRANRDEAVEIKIKPLPKAPFFPYWIRRFYPLAKNVATVIFMLGLFAMIALAVWSFVSAW